MRSVPPRVIKEVRDYLAAHTPSQRDVADVNHWIQLLGGALLPKRSAKPARERRETKAELRREKFSRVRKAAEKRAGGRCEACGNEFSDSDPSEADHIFGGLGRRRALEAVETVWLIHGRSCHRLKTANDPSALHWLCLQRDWADRHGYRFTSKTLNDRVERLYLQAALASEVMP